MTNGADPWLARTGVAVSGEAPNTCATALGAKQNANEQLIAMHAAPIFCISRSLLVCMVGLSIKNIYFGCARKYDCSCTTARSVLVLVRTVMRYCEQL